MGMAMTTRVFRILPERSGLSVAGGRLRAVPPVVADHQVEQGHQAAGGDAADGPGGGNLAAEAQVQQVPGQKQAHDELGEGLQHLGHRRGHHVRVALGIAPVGRHDAHKEAGQGHHPHRGGGQTVPLEVGQGLGKEEHDEAAGDAQHQAGGEGHPEHPADLVPPAQGVGLGDGLGHGHRQAGLGDHQQQVVDGVGVVEVAEAHVPQDAAQGDLVQGANYFDHRNAGGQDGRAAKEGICGECSFLQNSPSLRITRFCRLRRGGAGRRTSPRPGSSPGPG